jgi:hypothetical protein
MAVPTKKRTTTREVEIKARKKKGAGRFPDDCGDVEAGDEEEDDDADGGCKVEMGEDSGVPMLPVELGEEEAVD